MEHQTSDVYTAKYTPTKPGELGITFQSLTSGRALRLYYDGPIKESYTTWGTDRDLINDWGQDKIFRECYDDCSIKYFFYLKAPFTGDVTLILRADDTSTLFINKTEVVTANTTNDGMFLVIYFF